jgi:hypothetical protein
MVEYYINIKDKCGKNIVTREDGKIIHEIIVREWNKVEKIKIDFGNVLIASVSFIDEIFGKLVFDFNRKEVISKLQVINIQNYDRALLNDIFNSRSKQKDTDQNIMNI